MTIQPGEVVLLRWTDNDEDRDDQALAIEDLVVTATVDEDQAVPSVDATDKQPFKRIVNGRLVIIRDGVQYDVLGRIL